MEIVTVPVYKSTNGTLHESIIECIKDDIQHFMALELSNGKLNGMSMEQLTLVTASIVYHRYDIIKLLHPLMNM